MMYWKSLLLALKWSGPSLRVFIPNTSLFRPWWDAKQWFLKNFCITSFPLTLYDLFPPLIFFSLLPSSFSSLLQIPFFPCKILYIFRVSCLVSSALKKKKNRKHFTSPANKWYSNSRTSLKCLHKSRHTTNCHLCTPPRTSQLDDLCTVPLKWMVPFLPNSASSLNNSWSQKPAPLHFCLVRFGGLGLRQRLLIHRPLDWW